MHGSIRKKIVIYSILIVLVSSVMAMLGAVFVSVRHNKTADGIHLERALESAVRQMNEELHGMKTIFDGFAKDPINNYFIYNSIDINYFLWQDNSSILQLRDQMNADRMGFYYRSPNETDGPDRLYIFQTKDGPLYQLDADESFASVSLDEYGSPKVTHQKEPVPVPFDAIYQSGPMYSLNVVENTAVISARFELNRLSGEHIGYFIFEKKMSLDTINLNRELGVFITFYDLSGTSANSVKAMSTLPATVINAQKEDILLSSIDGETFDARVGQIRPLNDPIGYISVGIPTEETSARIRETVLTLLLLTVLISIPIAFFGAITVSRYMQPIITLTKVAQEMAKGNLNCEISLQGNDEISVLAAGFANMRDVIQQKIEELQAVNKELDNRVEKRSAELAQQNEMLNGLLDVLEDAVYFKDTEGRYTRVNTKYAKKLGKIVSSSIIGRKDIEFAGSMTNRLRIAEDAQVLKTGLTVKNQRGISYTEDGQQIEELWNKQPIRNADGDVVGMLTVIRELGVVASPFSTDSQNIDDEKKSH